ncbi:MAG: hypothetical protein [Circular genetic element sp.]|nr:MAG: hypothetical protein [Circular genetic element sp.]
MARIKTSSFYLGIEITDLTTAGGSSTLDISQYVNAPTGQALLVEEVQFCWYNDSTYLPLIHSSDTQCTAQLLDSTNGSLVSPISEELISQSHYVIDGAAGVYSEDDVMPDVMGYAAGDGRLVISSNLQLVADTSVTIANGSVAARIRCRVVNLDQKDWMALALQSVAE